MESQENKATAQEEQLLDAMAPLLQLAKSTEEVLDKCDTEMYPLICQMRGTQEGRKQVIKTVVSMVQHEGYTVPFAFAQLEREFNTNRIDD